MRWWGMSRIGRPAGRDEEGEIVEKVRYIKVNIGQAPERRSRLRTLLAGLNGWTVAWYVFLTAAGVLLYKAGGAYALRERGYYAVGGEALALLLPVLYYVMAATIRGIVRNMRNRRFG